MNLPRQRGPAVDEQLAAAIVAAVLATRAAPPPGRPVPVDRWADREVALRRPPRPGPDAWRFSLR